MHPNSGGNWFIGLKEKVQSESAWACWKSAGHANFASEEMQFYQFESVSSVSSGIALLKKISCESSSDQFEGPGSRAGAGNPGLGRAES